MFRLTQNSFVSGILSPSLFARSDLKAYYSGLADALNLVATKEGTLKTRPGIVPSTQSFRANTRVFPYYFNSSSSGFLYLYCDATSQPFPVRAWMGDKSFAATRESAQVLIGYLDIDDASAIASRMADIRAVQIGDTFYITLAGLFFRKLTVSFEATPISLAVEDWEQTGRPNEPDSLTAATSGHDSSHKKTIQYAAYKVRDSVQSKAKTRSVSVNRDSWPSGAQVAVSVTVEFPATSSDESSTAAIARASGIFECVILGKRDGGSAFGEISRFWPEDLSTSSSSNAYIQLKKRTQSGVTSYYWLCTFEFEDNNVSPGDQIAEQTNVLGAGFTAPLCVECFQQRLVFANAANDSGSFPMTLWFSEVGNLSNFYANRPSDDSDPFSPTVASRGPAFIRFMKAYQEFLVLFTDNGLWTVGFTQTSGFSATTCRISQFSDIVPAPDIEPVATPAGLFFVAADRRTIYSVSFDVQENALKPVNRSAFASALFAGLSVVSIALEEFPDYILWCVLSDGSMLSLTFEKDHDVFAWTRHEPMNDSYPVREIFATGSLTDGKSDLFLRYQNGSLLTHTMATLSHDTALDFASTPIAVYIKTLPLESQEQSLAGLRKNLKRATVRINAGNPVTVRNYLHDTWETLAPSETVLKALPRGIANEEGQIELATTGQAEIMAIIQDVEVS